MTPARDLAVATFLADVTAELAGVGDEATLTLLAARRAAELVGGDGSAVVARRRRGRLETVAATDEVALLDEELQQELDDGPLLTVLRDATGLRIDDTMRDGRWPVWGGRAAELGPRSVLCVRLDPIGLHERHGPLGVLVVHGLRVDSFDAEDLEVLLLLAVHVSVTWAALRRTVTLADAAESRHLVGVAQGMLAAAGVPVESSFALLQRWARDTNVRVRDLAERIIATGGVPDELDPRDLR
ncbi:MAG TPA: GAF and ANTAR domain-containing protein [Nocardioides sp.]